MSEENVLERTANTESKVINRPNKQQVNEQPSHSSPEERTIPKGIETRIAPKAPLLHSNFPLSQRQEMIRIISNRLFMALSILMAVTIVGGYLTYIGHQLSAGATNWMVMLCGAIGGFISLQRRLKTLHEEDLTLLARSWVYVLLSPLVGGILALLLFFLFISGLLDGDLFPDFEVAGAVATVNLQPAGDTYTGISVLFGVQGVQYTDYAKIIFWCFLAGYSESFVTNIISHFESKADSTAAGSQ